MWESCSQHPSSSALASVRVKSLPLPRLWRGQLAFIDSLLNVMLFLYIIPNLLKCPWGRHHYPHFIEEQTEVQKSNISIWWRDPESAPGLWGSKACWACRAYFCLLKLLGCQSCPAWELSPQKRFLTIKNRLAHFPVPAGLSCLALFFFQSGT